MNIKTSKLIGVALDRAVLCARLRSTSATDGKPILIEDLMRKAMKNGIASPSTDWQQGGPIIERELIETTRGGAYAEHFWKATRNSITAYGPTPLIAAMRCYVASKLGDEVEIPENLT